MAAPGVLIIVENLPVPNDRRVWLEATTLQKAGYTVSVISIKGKKRSNKSYEYLDNVHVYRYPAPPATSGTISFLIEFSYCWIMSFLLSIRVALGPGFTVIHACNPPETFWLIGLIYKLFGKKFIFDHHDLSPEMYLSRFGQKGTAYKGLLFLERTTFRVADRVLTTNETHKKVAIERGEYPAEKIHIVRSGPDDSVLYPVEPITELKKGFKYMVSYLGVINPQDGVDTLVEVAHKLIRERGREDILFVIMGTGDAQPDLIEQAKALGISEYFHFTGWVDQDDIRSYLSTTDVAVDTMPKTPYSDAATMNKILEYMAMGCAIACFDLVESQVSAGKAAVYARPDDQEDLADKIEELLADDARRKEMGEFGRQRIETELSWEHQSQNLLEAYRATLGSRAPQPSQVTG